MGRDWLDRSQDRLRGRSHPVDSVSNVPLNSNLRRHETLPYGENVEWGRAGREIGGNGAGRLDFPACVRALSPNPGDVGDQAAKVGKSWLREDICGFRPTNPGPRRRSPAMTRAAVARRNDEAGSGIAVWSPGPV